MPTLLEKMQAKLAQLEQGKKQFWQAKEGEHRIRILPSWEGPDGLFYKEVPTHYGIGPEKNRVVICAGEECPVCKRVSKLSVDPDPKRQRRAERMTVKNRIIMNIVDLGNPEKVLLWGAGEGMLQEILTYAMDVHYQNFTDPREGFNAIVKRTGQGLQTRWKLRMEPKPTPVDLWKTIKPNIFNLDEKFRPESPEQIKAVMRGEDRIRDDE